jgi:hypothetical protein
MTSELDEDLDDYMMGVMSDVDAAAFEERLFSAAASGRADEAAFVDKAIRIGQYLDPRGGWDIGSSKARVDALVASGLKVQIIDPEPSAPGQPLRLAPVADDAQIVVTVLRLDGRGYDSLEVLIAKPDGTELKTFRDVSCDPETGYLYAVCEAPLARISMQQRHLVSTLIGTRQGERHTLARFETLAS